MALFNGDTTAWEDVQIKMGNFKERDPKGPSMEATSLHTLEETERVAKQDFVNNLFDIEDNEDSELAALRSARLDQMKRQDTLSTVRRITKETYQDEVTEGSKTALVAVMMDRGGGSSFLESECRKLAKEWITEIAPSKSLESIPVRFYVGDVDELIGPQFPATSLPFAVIYSEGACQTQMANATVPGIRTGLIRFARAAIETKRTKKTVTDQDEDPMTRDIRRELAVRRMANESESEESEADISDDEQNRQRSKGYSDTSFERNVLRYR
jgi:hypothetical protein